MVGVKVHDDIVYHLGSRVSIANILGRASIQERASILERANMQEKSAFFERLNMQERVDIFQRAMRQEALGRYAMRSDFGKVSRQSLERSSAQSSQ